MTPQQSRLVAAFRDTESKWCRVATLTDIAETRASLALGTLPIPAEGVPGHVAAWVDRACKRIGEAAR